MQLIQILLPLKDNNGVPYTADTLQNIQKELCDKFNGLTAYNRAPADGLWKNDGKRAKDEIIIVEAMTEEINHDWWRQFRQQLEAAFSQAELVIRSNN